MEKKTNYSIQTLLDSRSFLYVLLFIVTICFVSTYTKIYDVKLDMNGDNIHYYALGKALAEGKGFTNTISFSETPHTHFPPGYPVFVAGVMKFFPDNINAVKIANGILLDAEHKTGTTFYQKRGTGYGFARSSSVPGQLYLFCPDYGHFTYSGNYHL